MSVTGVAILAIALIALALVAIVFIWAFRGMALPDMPRRSLIIGFVAIVLIVVIVFVYRFAMTTIAYP